jgi:GNAT superfamily N-acetyltransferase
MRAPVGLQICPMASADFSAANMLVLNAFQREGSCYGELARFHALQPEGLLLATLDGQAAGTVSAIEYGACAWIGLLAVAPALQGRGIGRMLMSTVLDWLDSRHCPLSLLDATPSGAPLYTSLGFTDYDETVLYGIADDAPGPIDHVATIQPLEVRDVGKLLAFDRAEFGADRSAALGSLIAANQGRTFVSQSSPGSVDGYVLASERRVGPLLAADEQVAAALLSTAFALPFAEPPQVIGPAANRALPRLLGRHGLVEQRRLRHMGRGSGPHPCRRAHIFGQASFALG